ncbi:MAG TPA: tellurite resistance/C4-dicarboxylate transporter family protein, partial [Tepidisphaeraceae bacterium]
LAGLHPAYFAMVMATGIVSLACHLLGFKLLANCLLALNLGFYAILWTLLIARLIRYPQRLIADLLNHGRCVGFFTIVAATCILGSQSLLIAGNKTAATGLWIFGIALWVGLTYTIFTALTVKSIKPTLPEGISGGWLLAVVAAQSVAVLGAQLAAPMGWTEGPVLFFCLTMWLGGGMLYIWIISLIFYRYTFFALHPSDLSPPYWINMGAVAISTLAGTMLAANASHSGGGAVVTEMLPFIKGFTLLFWATATWWIPMLVILGIWRHGFQRFPLRYDPLYWGAVFPLGMYAVCTIRLGQVINVPYLALIPRVFGVIAVAAWLTVFVGLLHSLIRKGNMKT